MVRVFVCVTGMPGSGKTSVARALAERLGAYVSMGDVVRAKAAELGLSPTSENLSRLAVELRRLYGADVVAREVARATLGYEGIVVVDGVRNLEEVEYLRSIAPTVVLAVHASPRARFSRLSRRGRGDDPTDYRSFAERDRRELELGVGKVIALADAVVVNEFRELDEVVSEALELVARLLRDVLTKG